MSEEYYNDEDGNFIGTFIDGAQPPAGSVACEKPVADPSIGIIRSLWAAAKAHEGSGGLDEMAAIMIQSKANMGNAKCQAVVDWVTHLWLEYYDRRDELSTNVDFSNIGTMPHSVRDCMAE